MVDVDVPARAGPAVVLDAEHRQRFVGRRERRAHDEVAQDPVLRRTHEHAADARALPRLRGDRDRCAVVRVGDDEVAVVAAAQPDRVARAHGRARVDRHERHARHVRIRRPVARLDEAVVEHRLQRTPRLRRAAVAGVAAVVGVDVELVRRGEWRGAEQDGEGSDAHDTAPGYRHRIIAAGADARRDGTHGNAAPTRPAGRALCATASRATVPHAPRRARLPAWRT